MLGLSLPDAVALLYVFFRIARAKGKALGESLHALISLLLLIGLFLGFRMAGEIRALLGEAANLISAIPGLGSRLLVILGAWYLMRLLRARSGLWIESAVPRRVHTKIVPLAEGVRAALLVGFIVWLAEGLFEKRSPEVPWLVRGVRLGDAWLSGFLN